MKPIFIHLKPQEQPLKVGASHWWGYPDLPPEVDIPVTTDPEDGSEYCLPLICQINLADLPADCTALPHKGLLLFFADIAYYRGDWDEPAISGYISDPDVVRVLYIRPEDMDRLENREYQYDPEEPELEAVAITLNHRRPADDQPDNILLGEAEHREWEDWERPIEGWIELLQMESCEGDA